MSGIGSFNVGSWLVEPELNRISRGYETAHLRPRVMDLLVYLAKQDGRVVSTVDIIDDLWSGQLITQGTVYNCVTELRQVLDAEGATTSIQNIPKKGYCLLAPVTGLEKAQDQGDGRHEKTWLNSTLAITAVIVVLLGIVGLVGWNIPPNGNGDLGPTASDEFKPLDNSIAVLPFDDLSADKSNKYLADGIAEVLIHQLSQVNDLRVIARQSAFSFKDKNTDIREIGRILNVESVFEGSVQRADDKLRIAVQLIDTRSGTHIWSKLFDLDEASIFAIQDELAAAVVDALKITLLSEKPKAPQTDPEAYALYLQARHLNDQRNAVANVQAQALLQQALEIDSGYAPAWIELSKVYGRQVDFDLASFAETVLNVREALNSALAIEPTDAHVHVRLSKLNADLNATAMHLQRALRQEPRNIEMLSAATDMLTLLGRFDEVTKIRKYIASRDPVNPAAHYRLGRIHFIARHWDEAIASFSTALKLSPNHVYARHWTGQALLFKGEKQAALESTRLEDRGFAMINLPLIYHAMGRSQESNAALAALIAQFEQVASYNIASVYAYRSEPDRAFEWLDKAVQYDDVGLRQITYEHLFSNLHDDPRWSLYLESIGKSPEQLPAFEFDSTLPD